MRKEEKELIFELCKFKSSNHRELKKLIDKGAATPAVLGYLFFNRVAAIAYGVLEQNNLLDKVNREFRNSLRNAYEQNKQKNISFNNCLSYLTSILSKDCGDKYALLKGAYLCGWYPSGYRTSNDIDLLILPENITPISNCLTAAGFVQGNIKNGALVPATRREIVSSKMMRGETVPFIKEVNLPYMKYFEVDINFSVSYRNENNDTVKNLLLNARERDNGYMKITTLDKYDFVLHLCEHLYKEAVIYPWIKMKRDMTLYKYVDIYALLSSFGSRDYEKLCKRAKQLNMITPCYYALCNVNRLLSLNDRNITDTISKIIPQKANVLDTVISPDDKKVYRYVTSDIKRLFFSDNRTSLLREVMYLG